jgi:hypothetical protein
MRRRAIVIAALVTVAVLAWGVARISLAAHRAPPGLTIHRISWATPARPHPHGPEADEVTRRSAGAWSGGAIWTGAGRHPVWRGCQHRYDPEMTSFIFGTAPPSG